MLRTLPEPLVSSRPKPLRPRRSKSVTIGLGFVCSDGVVLCSDREMSGGDFKYNEKKIYTLNWGDAAFIMTFAGLADVMKIVVDAIWKKMALAFTADAMKAALQATLDEVITPDPDQQFQLLVAFVSKDVAPFLVKTRDRQISPVFENDFIGFGDSALTRYLLEALVGDRRLTRAEAAVYGIYIVAQAKKYISGCGGPTDVHCLTLQGDRLVPGSVVIGEIEEHLDLLEITVSHLLSTGLHDTDVKTLKALAHVKEAMNKTRPHLISFKA